MLKFTYVDSKQVDQVEQRYCFFREKRGMVNKLSKIYIVSMISLVIIFIGVFTFIKFNPSLVIGTIGVGEAEALPAESD
jgi:hypothetical protein